MSGRSSDLWSRVGCYGALLALGGISAYLGTDGSSAWYILTAIAVLSLLGAVPNAFRGGPPAEGGGDLGRILAERREREAARRASFAPPPVAATPVAATPPADEAERRFREGLARAQEGKWNEAVRELSAAIAARPAYADAYFFRGKARVALGDRHGMVTDFKKALEAAPPGWAHHDEAHLYASPDQHRGR